MAQIGKATRENHRYAKHVRGTTEYHPNHVRQVLEVWLRSYLAFGDSASSQLHGVKTATATPKFDPAFVGNKNVIDSQRGQMRGRLRRFRRIMVTDHDDRI